MNGGNGNDDDTRGVLGQLVSEPPDGFGDRVRHRIERRTLGGSVATLVWHAPAAIFFELLVMVFELFAAVETGEGGTQ